jgi:hypothetical protein
VTDHSLLLRRERAAPSRPFPVRASRARPATRRLGPFHGPVFGVVVVMAAGAVAGMALAPPWAVIVLFVLAWGLLLAYAAFCRRGGFWNPAR